ncbi:MULTISPECIES: hypothetical protein [Roseomonadaceae]|uniref:Uncharacterized protein n=1 Tax=Falsiroseomonas oleicola TaxID=2801474 RepID=A0ABS6HJ25_9PROT|nr:hypothetical protein [Roseomonas oleicola]MBU8547255.1 hypothetical protein [Roseomonas oleicola]
MPLQSRWDASRNLIRDMILALLAKPGEAAELREPLLRTAELYAEDPLVPQAERDEWIRLARRLQRPADGTA